VLIVGFARQVTGNILRHHEKMMHHRLRSSKRPVNEPELQY